jgi:hypothetical protein
MTTTLLLSPPGTALRQVQSKLIRQPDIAVFDVEDELLTTPGLWQDPRFKFVGSHNVRELLGRLTRTEAMTKWADAFERSIANLHETEKPHKVLALHPSLYNPRRSEHFSTLGFALRNRPLLSDFDQVVLIIDDIFDMWQRLSNSPDDLFHPEKWLERRMGAQDQAWLSDLVRSGEAVEGLNAYIDGNSWSSSVTILSQLLSWRHFDMMAAESLADDLGKRLTVIGVKHPMSALTALLTRPTTTVYLSHPISRPRRAFAETGVWPEVVYVSNELSDRVAELDSVVICPTAIDEYRLLRDPDLPDWRAHEKTMELSERWPLIAQPEAAIEAASEPSSILRPIPPREAGSVSGDLLRAYARTLEDQIYAEVPFRDHFLVEHTDAFFVFRPLYQTGTFSRGVASEIDHWQNSVRAGETNRRAVFAHAPEDVAAWVQVAEAIERPYIWKVVTGVLEGAGVSQGIAEQVIRGTNISRDMLDTEPFGSRDLAVIQSQAFRLAGEALVHKGLTDLPYSFYDRPEMGDLASLLVMHSGNPSEAELRSANARLSCGAVGGENDNAFSKVEEILGVSLEQWVRAAL